MLLAIPALRAIRRRWPDDPVTLAAQPRIGALLTAMGIVDRSVAFDALGVDALFGAGTDEADGEWPARCGPDLRRAARVVSWFGSRDADFVRRLTRLAPGAIVSPSVGAERPAWEHLLWTVAAGAVTEVGDCRQPIALPASLAEDGRRELERAGWDGRAALLVVHPGAGGAEKRWPAAGFAAALDSVDAPGRPMVVLHRGPADGEAVEALRSRLPRGVAVLEQPALGALAGTLSHASAYLGNDSGVSHLAAALGARSVVLFTVDHLQWRPWARHVEPLLVSMRTVDPADLERVKRALAALAA